MQKRAEFRACANLPHLCVLNKPQAASHEGYPWVPPLTKTQGQQQQAVQVVPQWTLQEFYGNDKDYANENKQKYLFRTCSTKGISHNYLYICLSETQRQGGELESFILKEKIVKKMVLVRP